MVSALHLLNLIPTAQLLPYPLTLWMSIRRKPESPSENEPVPWKSRSACK